MWTGCAPGIPPPPEPLNTPSPMSPSLSLLSAPAGQVLRLALCSSSSLAASTRPRLAFARRTYASAPSSTAHPTTLAQQSPVAADQQKTDDRLQDLAHAEGPHFRGALLPQLGLIDDATTC